LEKRRAEQDAGAPRATDGAFGGATQAFPRVKVS